MIGIFRTKKDGVKIATTIIFEEMIKGAGTHYILGMIDFARRFGAITEDEQKGLIEHLEERGR